MADVKSVLALDAAFAFDATAKSAFAFDATAKSYKSQE